MIRFDGSCILLACPFFLEGLYLLFPNLYTPSVSFGFLMYCIVLAWVRNAWAVNGKPGHLDLPSFLFFSFYFRIIFIFLFFFSFGYLAQYGATI